MDNRKDSKMNFVEYVKSLPADKKGLEEEIDKMCKNFSILQADYYKYESKMRLVKLFVAKKYLDATNRYSEWFKKMAVLIILIGDTSLSSIANKLNNFGPYYINQYGQPLYYKAKHIFKYIENCHKENLLLEYKVIKNSDEIIKD